MSHEVVTKGPKHSLCLGLIQFHCHLYANEIHMQLQGRGDQNGLQQSFGMGTFMLNTPFTATDCSLHLCCQARPPELVLQQG